MEYILLAWGVGGVWGERERFLENEIMRLYYTQYFITFFFLLKGSKLQSVCMCLYKYTSYCVLYMYTHTHILEKLFLCQRYSDILFLIAAFLEIIIN